ncbi:MAG: hypothetical protein II937_13665 [Bacteroidales bacterium]|nr:hypothetical protein [Bacteroidales bacterium]
MENNQKEVSYPFAMMTAAIATMLAATMFDDLDKTLHDDNFVRAFKNMRLTRGAYKAWEDRVFNFDKYSRVKNDDMRIIQQKCAKIAEKMKPDTVVMKTTIANYMLSDDIIYENTLATLVVINSLLNLAVGVCEYVNTAKLSEAYIKTFHVIQPKQLYQNCKGIYDYMPMPDGFDLENSKDCVRCMDVLTIKIREYYEQEFCE